MTAGPTVIIDKGQRVAAHLDTHPLYRVSDEQAAGMYHVQKDFWSNREMTEDHLKTVLSSYAEAMEKPYLAPIAARIERIAAAAKVQGPVRVLELGGANAALLHWWRTHRKNVALRYTGIEPYKPFVDDVMARFPDAEMVQADAEAFAATNFEGRPPFTAFVAATIFCMVHPDVVRACIRKAATLADDLLIRDYLINVQGSIAADGHLLFDYYQKPHMPFMFAHRYDHYFAEAGFKVVHMEETRTPFDWPGWGLVHAQRASA